MAQTGQAAVAAPRTSPPGQTLRGVYRIAGVLNPASNYFDEGTSAFTFQSPLAAAPTAQFVPVNDPATAECPGTPAAPTAAAGYLCVYEAQNYQVDAVHIVNPETENPNESSRFGAAVLGQSEAGGTYNTSGTWAVTAP